MTGEMALFAGTVGALQSRTFTVIAWAFTLVVLTASGVAAQDAVLADTLSIARAGSTDGMADAHAKSLTAARWGTAAATFFLTPFVGGIGSLVVGESASGRPNEIPADAVFSDHPTYRNAYADSYQEVFLPRYRRTIRRSVLFTSIVFFAGAMMLAG